MFNVIFLAAPPFIIIATILIICELFVMGRKINLKVIIGWVCAIAWAIYFILFFIEQSNFH